MFSQIRNERGVSLLVTLSLMMLLGLVAMMSVDTAKNEVDMSFNQLHADQSLYVAQAGARRGVASLDSNYHWRGGFVNKTFTPGKYNVAVLDRKANAAYGDTIIVRATGEVSAANSLIEAWVLPAQYNPFKYAAYGKDEVYMENNAKTDSYSSDSTYAASKDEKSGDVGSDKKVYMKNSAVIGGDAQAATGGTIQITELAKVKGDTTSKAKPEPMNLVPDSVYTYRSTNNNNATGIIGGAGNYNAGTKAMEIQDFKTVTLKSGVYYFTKLHLKNSAQLQIEAGALVQIYVTGDIMFENSTKVNTTGKPIQCAIYSKGTKLDVKNGAEFRGGIYAPSVEWTHENDAQIYGSVIAKRAHLKNNAQVHFDRKMLEGNGLGGVKIIAWREV